MKTMFDFQEVMKSKTKKKMLKGTIDFSVDSEGMLDAILQGVEKEVRKSEKKLNIMVAERAVEAAAAAISDMEFGALSNDQYGVSVYVNIGDLTASKTFEDLVKEIIFSEEDRIMCSEYLRELANKIENMDI